MDVLGNYIGGEFGVLAADADAELVSCSPANPTDELGRFRTSVADVDRAVAAARGAFNGWAALPPAERQAAMLRLRAELVSRESAFVDCISREVGKPRWEALVEHTAMIAKVDVTLNEGLRLVAGFSPAELRGECRFRPHGVLAVIAPFTFPGHLPNGHIVPALVAGNTVVFKPSELTPAVGQLYAEAVHAAGIPRGVFNLVHGGADVGEKLGGAEGVDGVLFTGSYSVGASLQRANAGRPEKLLALELGGDCSALVLADADFDKAVYDVLFGAYITAGQRCTSTRRAVVHSSLVDRFAARMKELVEGLRIGPPAAANTFMGPMVSNPLRTRFLEATQKAKAAGAEVLVEAAPLEQSPAGFYVRPSLHRSAAPATRSDEVLGPGLTIVSFGEVEEGIALANASDYGLALSVFTRDAASFESCASRLEAGAIHQNAPTVGSSSRLPFGGTKRSGNGRPAGLFSPLYCSHPVAITRGEAVLDAGRIAPGITWS